MGYRFWTSYTSIRGKSYGAAAPAGDRVHVRGHSAGASVTPRARGGQDEFDVAMTTGNSQQGLSVHLGTVQGTPDGPRWFPADKPGKVPASPEDLIRGAHDALAGLAGAGTDDGMTDALAAGDVALALRKLLAYHGQPWGEA